MEVMAFLMIIMILMSTIDTCLIIKITQTLKEKPETVSAEYEKQIKNYRSIVRSQGKIIRLNEKEVQRNEGTKKTNLVRTEEPRRIY